MRNNKIQIIRYRKKDIIFVDLSDISERDDETLEQILFHGETVIRNSDRTEKALVLTDISGSKTNLAGVAVLAAFALGNGPYVEASAIVGAGSSSDLARKIIAEKTGREITSGFNTREEAFDWLVSR